MLAAKYFSHCIEQFTTFLFSKISDNFAFLNNTSWLVNLQSLHSKKKYTEKELVLNQEKIGLNTENPIFSWDELKFRKNLTGF